MHNITNKFHSNPFNYTGSKFRYLTELFDVLPKSDNLKVLDPFVGGGDLISKLNKTWQTTASDHNEKLIGLHLMMQNDGLSASDIVDYCNSIELSKTNSDAYYKQRDIYNKNQSPLQLYSLITHGFSNYMRLNSSGGYHTSFGYRYFNSSLQKKFDNYVSALAERDIKFLNKCYQDFDFNEFDLLLIDPPYSNTTATYNEQTGWAEKEDLELFAKIDEAAQRGTKFIYFNQLIANDIKNHALDKWIKKYNVRILKTTTDRCSGTKKHGRNTVEVMVWN